MAKLTKKLTKAYAAFDINKIYPLEEAIKIAQKNSISKFEGSIDVAIKLNLDTTKAEQQLRGSISLPHSTGKKIVILALTDDLTAAQAKECGADYYGVDENIQKIQKGWMDFDLIITSSKVMPKLARLGKTLGPRGLMPNPKTGTVTNDIAKTVKEFKKGRTEYRTDTYGNIHMGVGKVKSKPADIADNIEALLGLIKSKRPTTVKGIYIQNISVSPTMGPGIKVQIN